MAMAEMGIHNSLFHKCCQIELFSGTNTPELNSDGNNSSFLFYLLPFLGLLDLAFFMPFSCTMTRICKVIYFRHGSNFVRFMGLLLFVLCFCKLFLMINVMMGFSYIKNGVLKMRFLEELEKLLKDDVRIFWDFLNWRNIDWLFFMLLDFNSQ